MTVYPIVLLITLLTCLVVGAAVGYRFLGFWRQRWQERESQLAAQQQRIAELEGSKAALQTEKVRLETLLHQYQTGQDAGQLQAEGQGRRQAEYLRQSLLPLQEQIRHFEQQLLQQHQDGIRNTAQLEQYLRQQQENIELLSSDAQNLAEALKGDSRCQGAWGEMILSRALEQSGLREGVEYQLQKSFVNAEGKLFRPDVVVQFPGQRYIVIDAKVSLQAYSALLGAEDEGQRHEWRTKHRESLARHVKELADKDYQNLLGLHPDFVLLFCPIEGALAEALRLDNQLFELGFRRHVILVSPSLLLVVLRIVEQLWRYDKQQHNVSAIYAQAGKIHDKFARFCDDMSKVEKQASSLHKSVEEAIRRLWQGRGSLGRQVEKLQELGADTARQMPDLPQLVAGGKGMEPPLPEKENTAHAPAG